MKKVLIGIGAMVLLGALAGAGYYFYPRATESGPTDFVSKWDLMDQIEPVTFPMRDQRVTFPETDISALLNLVSTGDRRNYPMARAELPERGVVSLTAIDDFVSDEVAGKRAVLLRLVDQDLLEQYYLGIVRDENTQITHLSSLYVGDHIRPQRFEVVGENLVFYYLVHDREQPFNAIPLVETSMTVAMTDETVLIAGRSPKTETVIAYKAFSGVYRWEYTAGESNERVAPVVPETFTLRFNANRLELETDCNAASAIFVTEPLPATTFTVEPLVATSRFCESAQEDDYFAMIEAITSYTEAEDGQLTFTLGDGREMVFVPRERVLEFSS